jgi:7-carboxy-7-deazaguanine synthase
MASLRIAEIFSSIQGEGIWVGTPSTFVRVSGCNLRCGWCDTPYASWEPEGPVLRVEDIMEQVRSLANRHVVLTGGEPMLFDAIEALALFLDSEDYVITIETAGTVFRELPCELMSISPKLSNSRPEEALAGDWARRHEETRSNLEPLRRLVERYPFQLKFVVNPEGDHDDLGEIEQILSQLPSVPPERVVLMAEGVDSETVRRRMRALVPICRARGFRLTPRLHLDLFGNQRGT